MITDEGNSAEIDRLLTRQELATLLRCSCRHLLRMESSGQFPAPILVGSLRRWRETDIRDWLSGSCAQEVPRE